MAGRSAPRLHAALGFQEPRRLRPRQRQWPDVPIHEDRARQNGRSADQSAVGTAAPRVVRCLQMRVRGAVLSPTFPVTQAETVHTGVSIQIPTLGILGAPRIGNEFARNWRNRVSGQMPRPVRDRFRRPAASPGQAELGLGILDTGTHRARHRLDDDRPDSAESWRSGPAV